METVQLLSRSKLPDRGLTVGAASEAGMSIFATGYEEALLEGSGLTLRGRLWSTAMSSQSTKINCA